MTDNHDKDGGDGKVQVHFKHVPEAEKANFKMPEISTLQVAWDQAYVELGIERGANDLLQTAGGHPQAMANYLGYTLAALKAERIIQTYNFEILAPTGGAGS